MGMGWGWKKNHGDGVRFGLNFNTVSLFNIHPTSFLLSQFFRKSAHALVEPIFTFNTSYDVVLSKVVPFVAKKFNVHIIRNFPSATFRTMTFREQPRQVAGRAGVLFGKRPRRETDAQVLLLAGSQHRCAVDRADALKECLRCVGIFDWKD